jgi:hypothetical protein
MLAKIHECYHVNNYMALFMFVPLHIPSYIPLYPNPIVSPYVIYHDPNLVNMIHHKLKHDMPNLVID